MCIAGKMLALYRSPLTACAVYNPYCIWPWRSLCPISSKSHQNNAPEDCRQSQPAWAAQPVHTGSEEKTVPSRLPTRGLDIHARVWTPPLTPPPPPGLQLYHNCTITYNHSKLTEMNSPPWGQKWSVDWYVCSGPHFLLAVWSSWVLSYEVPNQFSVTGWIVGMTAK